MGSPRFPEPPPSVPATTTSKLDAAVAAVQQNTARWASLGPAERIRYLDKMMKATQRVARDWAEAGCRAKGIQPTSPLAGEEWLAGPYQLARNIRLFAETMKANGQPKLPKVEERGGRTVVTVYPQNTLDKLVLPVVGEVILSPGKPATQGRIYREKNPEGKLCLVLGAGNISCIGPMDVLTKMFEENELCILKMNPVNDYAGPYIEKAMQCLVDDGLLAVVYGGAEVGKHLTHHADIDTIHITGSASTHDAIIWGARDVQEQNKKNNTPVVDKPITSELGAVTPLLVVPGAWTDAEMAFQCAHIAAMISHNGSFDCNAIKSVLIASGWKQKDEFKKSLRQALRDAPPRKAYYPGAQARYQKFLDTYPNAEVLGETGADIVPWTILPDVKPDRAEYALSNEAFCGVVAETEIEANDAPTFLKEAVRVANEEMFGTLSCAVLCDPRTEQTHKAVVEQALLDLRYGGVAFNIWPGVIFGLVNTTWGAFPGHPLTDIASGRGTVHNSLLLDHPEKSIVRAPFVMFPKPLWFPDHKTLAALAEKLTRFEEKPSLLKLPSIAASAVLG